MKYSFSGLAMPKTIPASCLAWSSKSKSAATRSAQGVLVTAISIFSSTSQPSLRPFLLLHFCLARPHIPTSFTSPTASVSHVSDVTHSLLPNQLMIVMAKVDLSFKNENISKLRAFSHTYLIISEHLYVLSKCLCQTVRSLINIMLMVILLYKHSPCVSHVTSQRVLSLVPILWSENWRWKNFQ